jgi:phosphotriesterase-related protein
LRDTLVRTATGSVEAGELGLTSMHEHVPLDRAGDHREDACAFAVAELRRARALGLETIVEVSPRRDAAGIREISRATGVKIVLCTGFYLDLSDEEKSFAEEDYYAHIMREVEQGIGETGLHPGVIKVAARSVPPAPHEERLLLAAGRAQRACGLPVCTHAVTGCAAQQALLERGGADLGRVYFSHVEAEFGWEGRSLQEQIRYLLQVASRGSVLCYNNFGNVAHTSEENLLAIISAMIGEGYVDRQVATMDLIWSYPQGRRQILWEDINPEGAERTYAYLLSRVLPWLRENHIPESAVSAMVRETPHRLLG